MDKATVLTPEEVAALRASDALYWDEKNCQPWSVTRLQESLRAKSNPSSSDASHSTTMTMGRS